MPLDPDAMCVCGDALDEHDHTFPAKPCTVDGCMCIAFEDDEGYDEEEF